ncbi:MULTISPECIES: polysaccharide deacetylase family protein [unclassified Paenibacillus]|uniref:polysaccharide deacetylase family protein n=1 Tax=unclassified Paenibacillus TaxID=185978 RepID=UPI00095499C0|nr:MULTISPECIES: polysaccharide deacetylase family protein [unclassified Paenibacillus]ASS65667.1 polysaccharide deacetylase family protein [Paenibacillus sp. RUD330]SIQ27842.1 probable sporulation protein, polysaccharide deacetylase family [Paenibacillus sp. RU4X]SIQ50139.1 probable sporulation protein, polysaccharide deacetylase family [Paenibacillus sp. RU4T]
MKLRQWGLSAAFGAAVVLLAVSYGGAGGYVQAVKSGESRSAMLLTDNEEALRTEIKLEAEKRYIPPVDAKVDRWFRAIPGYDGREVDIEATYRQAQLRPDGPVQYVYKAVKPKVSVENYPLEPIYRGNPAKPTASFMINVAWGNEYLEPMLATLDRFGVKATFFLDGSWLKKYPEEARKIQAAGHEISNHAYSHPDMSKLGMEQQTLQITRTELLLKETLAVSNRLFAPPSGSYNASTVKAARAQGLRTVMWTLDTVDWRKPSPGAVVDKIARGIGPGSLILMHPTASSRDALEGMIKAAKRKGLLLVPVSETISEERIEAPVEAKP